MSDKKSTTKEMSTKKVTKAIDKRYTIGLEFCGFPEQKHVLRFCGEFIAPFHSLEKAQAGQCLHYAKLTNALNELDAPILIEDYKGYVLLLKMSEGNYRTVYGAEVQDFKDLGLANIEFQDCKKHAKKAL